MRKRTVQLVAAAVAYTVVFVGGIWAMFSGALTPYFALIRGAGWWGNVLIVVSFIPASLPFLAGYTPLTLASGYIYGVTMGSITSEIGAVLGGIVAFLATRAAADSPMMAWMTKSRPVRQFCAAVDKHGFVVIALLRCAPVPYGLQNGAFALSNVSFKRYVAATIVGLVPEQVMFCYMGSTLKSLADVAAGHDALTPAQTYALYAQMAFAVVVFVVIARIGKRALKSASGERAKMEDVQLPLEFSDAELGALSGASLLSMRHGAAEMTPDRGSPERAEGAGGGGGGSSVTPSRVVSSVSALLPKKNVD